MKDQGKSHVAERKQREHAATPSNEAPCARYYGTRNVEKYFTFSTHFHLDRYFRLGNTPISFDKTHPGSPTPPLETIYLSPCIPQGIVDARSLKPSENRLALVNIIPSVYIIPSTGEARDSARGERTAVNGEF